MQNPNEDALARLQADWPLWEVWVVPRAVGGPVWCARRHEDRDAVPARVLNTDSPGHLGEYIAEAESE